MGARASQPWPRPRRGGESSRGSSLLRIEPTRPALRWPKVGSAGWEDLGWSELRQCRPSGGPMSFCSKLRWNVGRGGARVLLGPAEERARRPNRVGRRNRPTGLQCAGYTLPCAGDLGPAEVAGSCRPTEPPQEISVRPGQPISQLGSRYISARVVPISAQETFSSAFFIFFVVSLLLSLVTP